MTVPHILVIGGGFSGVSAAHHLLARGAAVTLLDRARSLGGRARSDAFGAVVIDTGAQLIASSFSRTTRLLADPAARVLPSLERTPGRDAIVIQGRRHDIQFGSLRSLLGFAGLSTMDKLRLGRHLLPLLARHRSHLDASTTRIPLSLDRESSAAFIGGHAGTMAAELLAETSSNAFYSARGDETSLAFLLTLARYGSDAEMLAAREGWSALLTAPVAGATIVCSATVTGLRTSPTGVTVTTDDGRQWQGDGVVLATDARTAGALLESADVAGRPLLEWLATVPLRPTLTLALEVDAELDRTRFGIFHARSEARVVSACAVYAAKFPGAYSGREIVLAWPTPEQAAVLAGATSSAVVDAMLPETEKLLPAVSDRVTRARIYRFPEGTPLPFPGFVGDRAHVRRLAERLPSTVALAGDHLTAPIIEGAVMSGEWAAARIAAAFPAR